MENGNGAVNWAILCPGPSLKTVKDVEADNGGIIAVNGAILHPLGILSNWWAVVDPDVFRSCFEKENLAAYTRLMTIWTHSGFEQGALSGRIWTDAMLEMFRRFEVRTWENMGVYGACTMLTAVFLAARHGAKIVRIYGADLGGAGYFTEGLLNSKTKHNQTRWMNERSLFNQIAESMSREGVDLVRVCQKENL